MAKDKKRKSFTPGERQAYLEAKQAQREELESRVHDLVDSFRDSDTFKDYLSKMSEFNRTCEKYLHHYSPNNLLYIMIQDPTARLVGSATAWRKMGRFVNKGEHSHIQVWAPIKEAVMRNKLDDNGQPILKEDGTPEREPARDENGRVVYRFSGRFTLKPVFDISQTGGEPLPELAQELKNPVDHYADYEKAIREASPLPIYFSDAPEAEKLPLGEAKGVCSFRDKMIVVKAGMSQEHTLKTMVHEVTHAKFHSPDKLKAVLADDKEGLSKNAIEVQAECTAFVVCDHFGMDTSDYSIPYIMSWGEDRKLTPLTNSLDAILKASREIIDQMETHLWVDMGIDETLKDAGLDAPYGSSSALIPAIYDPSMAVDLDHLLANKTVSALQDIGFKLVYEKPALPNDSPSIALTKETADGTVRIDAKLFFDKDGYAVPDFDSHGTTLLSAFKKGVTEPFFADNSGNLVDQFRELEKRVSPKEKVIAKSEASVEPGSSHGMLSDPRAQKLMRAGYVVREKGIDTPYGQANGLSFVKSNGVYRIQVELVPDYSPLEGNPAVIARHPATTALTAYDLTGKEPEVFFEERFNASIQDQMADLRANGRYQVLHASVQDGRSAPIQDPISYMKQKREANRSQVVGPHSRANRSMRDRTQTKRNYSMER